MKRFFSLFFVVGVWGIANFSSPVFALGKHPPQIIHASEFSGQSYLSLNDVAAVMQAHVHAVPASKRVDLSFRAHEVEFVMGSTQAVVDGHPETLDAPPVEDHRGTWVPRHFFKTGSLAPLFLAKIDLGPIGKPIQPAAQKSASKPVAVPPVPRPEPKPIVVKKPDVPASTADVAEESTPEPHVIRRIVIDPGHGGKDPGAMGSRGTEEKAINLWMGQELADALREHDFEVLLTRTDDTFIPLAERAALANRHKADLFISVHCNASLSPKLSGFEVYILSEKASDPHAAAVARLENASLELEGKTPSAPVQAVLRSLVKNANINRSAQLGSIMDRQVDEQLAQPNTGLQQAAFYVLRGAQMPAVLVELGFLSNKVEEGELADSNYRKKLVKAIEASIVSFDKKQREALK